MNINLHILKEELKKWDFQGCLNNKPIDLNCSWHLLCEELPASFKKNILYIMPSDLLKHRPCLPLCSTSVICVGKPSQDWMDSGCNFLYTEADISLIVLNNEVSEVFYRYNKWEADLQEVLDQHLPLQKFAMRSIDMFSNNFSCISASYELLFAYFPREEGAPNYYENYKKGYFDSVTSFSPYVSNEDITSLLSDEDFYKMFDSQEPGIYPGKPFGFRTLYYTIRLNGVFFGWMFMDEIITPITAKDYVIIKILGDFISKAFSIKKSYSIQNTEIMNSVMCQLLDHRLLPLEKINDALATHHWNMNDSYFCMILSLNAMMGDEVSMEALALNLSYIIKDSSYAVYQGYIVYTCNLSVQKNCREQILTSILPVLRDNLMIAGISTIYRDFKNLYYYYHQAIMTIKIGQKKKPDHWYFRFEDYHMDYLLFKYTEKSIPEVFIPEELKALIDYDRQNKTEYALLLREFLNNDRSVADTVRAVYMHRNTFNYRIKRLKELLHMDLNNPDVRIILQLSFKILDSQN